MSAPGDLNRVRYVGLLAAAVLAAGACAAGALPGAALPSGDRSLPWQVGGVAAWVVGTGGLVIAWWRVGRRVRAGGVELRWLYVTGALWALPLLLAPPLSSRDIYSYACQGALYSGGVDPYTYGPAAGGCPWLATVAPLWRNTPSPYGPLAVTLSGAAVRLAGLLVPKGYAQLLVTIGLLRVLAAAGLALLAWSATRLARLCGVDPVRVAWLGVLSPLVAVHVLSAAHHDGLLAGLAVAGLALAAARRTTWLSLVVAGALVGLAVAVKVTAVVVLPFALLLAWPGGRVRAAASLATGAAAAYAGVSALTGMSSGLGWLEALPETGKVVQWTSVPTGVGMAFGYALRAFGVSGAVGSAVAATRAIGFVVLAACLVALWLRAARSVGDTRAVIAHCGLALGAAALLSPVFFPWYVVATVAVLAATLTDPRAVRWLALAVAVLSLLVLPDGHGLESRVKVPGAIADLVLVVVLTWRQRHAVAMGAKAAARRIRHVLVVWSTSLRDEVAS